jgi:hypothetical protein
LRDFLDETLAKQFKIRNRRSRSSLVIAQGRAVQASGEKQIHSLRFASAWE